MEKHRREDLKRAEMLVCALEQMPAEGKALIANLIDRINDASAGLTAIEALSAYSEEISEHELNRSTHFIVQCIRDDLQKVEGELRDERT